MKWYPCVDHLSHCIGWREWHDGIWLSSHYTCEQLMFQPFVKHLQVQGLCCTWTWKSSIPGRKASHGQDEVAISVYRFSVMERTLYPLNKSLLMNVISKTIIKQTAVTATSSTNVENNRVRCALQRPVMLCAKNIVGLILNQFILSSFKQPVIQRMSLENTANLKKKSCAF